MFYTATGLSQKKAILYYTLLLTIVDTIFPINLLNVTATQPQASFPPSKSNAVSYQVGVLYRQNSQGDRQGFPMGTMNVKVKLEGNNTQVEVNQEFSNSYGETVDAIYRFPLPYHAVLDEFVIQVGDRTLPTDPKPEENSQFPEPRIQPKNQIPPLSVPQTRTFFTQFIPTIKPGEKIKIRLSFTEGVN